MCACVCGLIHAAVCVLLLSPGGACEQRRCWCELGWRGHPGTWGQSCSPQPGPRPSAQFLFLEETLGQGLCCRLGCLHLHLWSTAMLLAACVHWRGAGAGVGPLSGLRVQLAGQRVSRCRAWPLLFRVT